MSVFAYNNCKTVFHKSQKSPRNYLSGKYHRQNSCDWASKSLIWANALRDREISSTCVGKLLNGEFAKRRGFARAFGNPAQRTRFHGGSQLHDLQGSRTVPCIRHREVPRYHRAQFALFQANTTPHCETAGALINTRIATMGKIVIWRHVRVTHFQARSWSCQDIVCWNWQTVLVIKWTVLLLLVLLWLLLLLSLLLLLLLLYNYYKTLKIYFQNDTLQEWLIVFIPVWFSPVLTNKNYSNG